MSLPQTLGPMKLSDLLTRVGKPLARTLLFLSIVGAMQPAISKEVALTGPQIRAAISGMYVTDEHHWGHKYFSDGRVERSENGRRRPARWSIKGDRLCLLQPEISKDEPVCYHVVRIGDELQYRDDHFVAYRGLIRPMPVKD